MLDTFLKSSIILTKFSGNSSVGRARPCQGRGREFESRFPLQILKSPNHTIWTFLLFEIKGLMFYHSDINLKHQPFLRHTEFFVCLICA